MLTRKLTVYSALLAMTVASFPAAASAREHERDHDRWHGDIRFFHVHDYPTWRGGRWYHGWHDGRIAWWWIAAGTWYFFNRPVYPYPDPYVPPTVVVQPQVTAVVPPAAPAVPPPDAPPPPQAQAQNWYFCKSSGKYYPYVSSCPEGWMPVPATPPQ